MTGLRTIGLFSSGAAAALVAASAGFAQRAPATPEQRIERLERQVQQMQRQVFPRGRPATTAGFADDPAASQSTVIGLAQRLEALERQLADLVRLAEENGNSLRNLQADVAKARADSDGRIAELERRIAEAMVAPAVAAPAVPTTTAKPRPTPSGPATTPPPAALGGPAADPAEDAYTRGFKLWEAGDHDAAIRALRGFVAEYPAHRRVSFANNLIGRSLLAKGEARAATEVLLANYRRNPQGERAADSLYYLGQALMELGQPGQACKAYAELDAVYGARVRPELKQLAATAKAEAGC